eukprot:m.36567 g.36567  ORF g.36567 m.36567 type:complete len:237 (+) comp17398_c0_seq1:1044-1754(+)
MHKKMYYWRLQPNTPIVDDGFYHAHVDDIFSHTGSTTNATQSNRNVGLCRTDRHDMRPVFTEKIDSCLEECFRETNGTCSHLLTESESPENKRLAEVFLDNHRLEDAADDCVAVAEDCVALADVDDVGTHDDNMSTLAVSSMMTFPPVVLEDTNANENECVDGKNTSPSRTYSITVSGQVITRKYPPPPTSPPPRRRQSLSTPQNQVQLSSPPTSRARLDGVIEDWPGRIIFYSVV